MMDVSQQQLLLFILGDPGRGDSTTKKLEKKEEPGEHKWKFYAAKVSGFFHSVFFFFFLKKIGICLFLRTPTESN